MDSDLETTTWASIERNIAANRRLESQRVPDPPREAVMTPETFMAHKARADAIAARLNARAQNWSEGPRGS